MPLNNRRQGDWYYFCQQCNTRCYASETTKLGTYTGKGGLRVCPKCVDAIDYKFVPYKIPAEKPVPFSRDASQIGNIGAIKQQYPTQDPLWGWWTNPNQLVPWEKQFQNWDWLTMNWELVNPYGINWEQQTSPNWEDWTDLWGQAGQLPGGADIDEYGYPAQGKYNTNPPS